ncbi:MAG: Crp/Fnr family transcriptional regulator [Rubrivivax sp.]|nr:MAG: Crp/Fnr family transcriptional regulator [Rubrivivax sp.]
MTDMKEKRAADTDAARIEAILKGCPDTSEIIAIAGDALCRNAVLMHCAPKSLLWMQGTPPTHVLITSGPACIYSYNEQGNLSSGSILITTSHLMGEAEVFARFESRPNEALVMAQQDVVKIPAQDFLSCVEGSPELCRFWLRSSNLRFVGLALHAQLMSTRSAEERLRGAVMFMGLLGSIGPDGAVLVRCSQETLANTAALTRPAAAKVIAGWRKKGWIETGYETFRILRPEAFQL